MKKLVKQIAGIAALTLFYFLLMVAFLGCREDSRYEDPVDYFVVGSEWSTTFLVMTLNIDGHYYISIDGETLVHSESCPNLICTNR